MNLYIGVAGTWYGSRTPKTSSNPFLIKCDWEIGFETPTVDGVHVIRCTFINTSIHLSGRINFNFWFYLIVAYSPLMYLQANYKAHEHSVNYDKASFKWQVKKKELFSIMFSLSENNGIYASASVEWEVEISETEWLYTL